MELWGQEDSEARVVDRAGSAYAPERGFCPGGSQCPDVSATGAAIPPADKRGRSFSELWESYRQVFPRKTPRRVGKGNGETTHMERWNNTLRQRKARSVRRTLAFAKSDFSHELVTRLFILRYNLVRRSCVI